MTVTEVKPGKRGLMYVHIDGEYAFSAYPEILYEFSVSGGSAVDAALLSRVLEKQNRLYAKNKALDILTVCDCSERTLFRKLCEKGIDEKNAAAAVADAVRMGAVNDERYLDSLIPYLAQTKKYGKRRMREYLMIKGFDRGLVESRLNEYDADETQVIVSLLEKLPPGELNDRMKLKKQVEKLLRRGFSYQDIRTAAAQVAQAELEYEES